MKSLILIDDKFIRKNAFAQAEKILKKIDRLEADLESFHDRDQRLFSNWYDLTFRDEQEQIKKLQDEHRSLSHRYNWMVAISRMRRISLPAAFVYLRREEQAYATGSESKRAEIEQERKERDEFIRQEVEGDYGFNSREEFESIYGEEPEDAQGEDSELDPIRELTDKQLHKMCRDKNTAFSFLTTILACARSNEDYVLFLRIWSFVPPMHRSTFTKAFAKQNKASLEDFIEQIREHLENVAASDDEEELHNGGDDYERSNATGFSEEDFVKSHSSKKEFSKKRTPEEEERIKILYRKLIRHLHPDLQTHGGGQSHWQKNIWERVQNANQKRDRNELEKLLRLVLIRTENLNDLTISEIIESQDWLKEEFKNLNQEARGLKNLPAWGFSRRRDYKSLRNKVAKPLVQQLRELDHILIDLRAQNEAFEKMGSSQVGDERPRPRRRRVSKRRS